MKEKFLTLFDSDFFAPIIAIGSTLLFALVCTLLIGYFVDKLAKRYEKSRTQLIFLKHIVNAVIIAFTVFNVLIQIDPLKKLALSIAASSSVLAVAVALASQEAMTNVVSGFFLSIFKPFKIGDRIKIADKNIVGFIEEITMRHTVLRTFEQSRVVIPNSVMNSAIVENFNLITDNICSFLEIGISYKSNIDQAMNIIAQEVLAHPNFCDIRTAEEKNNDVPPVVTRVVALSASSVDLKTTLWAKDAGSAFVLCCDLRKSVKEHFDRDGIEIPFTQMVVHLETEK